MEIHALKNSDKAWTWVAQDFADEELRPEHFCIRFKTADIAAAFKAAFEKALNIAKENEAKKVASPSIKSTTNASPVTQTPFGIKFLPKAGSWTCPTCYVSNAADKLLCAACETKKPGSQVTADSHSISVTTSNSNSTANQFTFGTNSLTITSISSPKNGGFTFSTSPMIQETQTDIKDREILVVSTKSKNSPQVTKVTAPKPSPFSGFSFKSPPTAVVSSSSTVQSVESTENSTSAENNISKIHSMLQTITPDNVFGSKSTESVATFPSFSVSVSKSLAESTVPTSSVPLYVNVSAEGHRVSTDAADGAPEEFVPTAEFKRIVPLPALVDVKTGEGEEKLFGERAKLFRFDPEGKEWKERGIGELKILFLKDSKKYRILMRREQVLKICANYYILPDMKLTPLATNDNAWVWFAQDFSDGDLKKEQFAAKFKTKEIAQEFFKVFQKCQSDLKEIADKNEKPQIDKPQSDTCTGNKTAFDELFKPIANSWECSKCQKSNMNESSCVYCGTPKSGTSVVTSKSGLVSEQKPLSELFKPDKTSWECQVCYVRNKSCDAKCVSCESPKPSSSDAFNKNAVSNNQNTQPIYVKNDKSEPLTHLFKPPTGSWQCQSCLIQNNSDADKCAACETKKPGSSFASSTFPSSDFGKFQFGSPVQSNSSTEKTSPFSFGSNKPSSGNFLFGMKPVTGSYISFGLSSVIGKGSETVGFKPTLLTSNTPAVFGGTTQKSDLSEKKSIPTPQTTSAPTDAFGNAQSTSIFSFGSPAGKDRKCVRTVKEADSSSVEFRFGSPQKYEFNFSGVRPRSPTKTPKSPKSPATPSDVDEDDERDSFDADNIYFQPAIPLPPKVLFKDRAKLYRFMDKEWKERGIGTVKILHHEGSGRVRLLMRRNQVLKVCANHYITPNMEIHALKNSDKAWTWVVQDFVDEELRPKLFCIHFKTAHIAAVFRAAFEKALNIAKENEAKKVASPTIKATTNMSSVTQEPFVFRFLPKAGSWKCPTCYVSNAADKLLCIVCETKKPGFQFTEGSKSISVTTTISNSTANQFTFSTNSLTVTSVSGPKNTFGVFTFTASPVMQGGKTGRIGVSRRRLRQLTKVTAPKSSPFSEFSVKIRSVVTGKSSLVSEQKPLSDRFKPDKSSWECQVCYVRNKSCDAKCVSCESPKPSSSDTFNKNAISNNQNTQPISYIKNDKSEPLTNLFKPPAESWQYQSCFTQNNSGADKCAVCETKKPGSSFASSAFPSSSDFGKFQFGSPVQSNSSTEKTSSFSFGSNKPSSGNFLFGMKPVTGSYISFGLSSVIGKGSETVGFKPTLLTSNTPADFGGTTQKSDLSEKKSIPIPQTTSTPTDTFRNAPSTSIFSFGSPAGKEADSSSVGFHFGNTPKYEFNFSDVRPRSPTKTPKSPATPLDVDEDDEGDLFDADNIYFQSAIPLPPKVDVKTGEENEDVMFCKRAKLFRFTAGEWKERGIGDIKILFDKKSKKARLLMRRDQVLKVCLNHHLTKEIVFEWRGEKSLTWAATDFSENEASPELFAIRFKTSGLAQQFKDAIDDALKLNALASESEVSSEQTSTTTKVMAGFSFKSDCSVKTESPFSAGSLSACFGTTLQGKLLFGNSASVLGTTETNPSSSVSPFFQTDKFGTNSVFGQNVNFSTNSSKSIFVGHGFKFVLGSDALDKKQIDKDNDIEIVYEATASPDKIAEAEKLKLPRNFYLYESKPPCKGCRGCTDTICYKDASADVEKNSATKFTELTQSTPQNEISGELFATCAKRVTFADLSTNSSFESLAKLSSTKNIFAGAGIPLFFNANNSTEDAGAATEQKPQGKDVTESQVSDSTKQNAEKTEISQKTSNALETQSNHVAPESETNEHNSDEESEEDDFVFEKRVSFEIFDESSNQFKPAGMSTLQILYDDTVYGYRILMMDDKDNCLCENVIAIQTCLRVEGKKASWTAIDLSVEPPKRRQFRATFSSLEAVDEFNKQFEEGKELAVNSEIVEKSGDYLTATSASTEQKSDEKDFTKVQVSDSTMQERENSMISQKTSGTLEAESNHVVLEFETNEHNPKEKSEEGDFMFGKRMPFEAFYESSDQFKTGKPEKESEEVIFCEPAALFCYTSREGNVRGDGDVKVLFNGVSKKAHLVMRKEHVLKVCLNHYLVKEMSFEWWDDKSMKWAAIDFFKNKPSCEIFAVQFETSALAYKFKEAIEYAMKLIKEAEISGDQTSMTTEDLVFSIKTNSPFTESISSRLGETLKDKPFLGNSGLANISEAKTSVFSPAFELSSKNKFTSPAFTQNSNFSANNSKPVFTSFGFKFEPDDCVDEGERSLPTEECIDDSADEGKHSLTTEESIYYSADEGKHPLSTEESIDGSAVDGKHSLPKFSETNECSLHSENSKDMCMAFIKSAVDLKDLATHSTFEDISKPSSAKTVSSSNGNVFVSSADTRSETGEGASVDDGEHLLPKFSEMDECSLQSENLKDTCVTFVKDAVFSDLATHSTFEDISKPSSAETVSSSDENVFVSSADTTRNETGEAS